MSACVCACVCARLRVWVQIGFDFVGKNKNFEYPFFFDERTSVHIFQLDLQHTIRPNYPTFVIGLFQTIDFSHVENLTRNLWIKSNLQISFGFQTRQFENISKRVPRSKNLTSHYAL